MLKLVKILVGSALLFSSVLSTQLTADEKYTANECFEKFSRGTLKFNQGLDKAIFKPVAKGYRALPMPLRQGTSKFVGNKIAINFSKQHSPGGFKRCI